MQLAPTLAVHADTTRRSNRALAARLDAERISLVQQIGPQARGLTWSRGVRLSGSDNATRGPLTRRESEVAVLIAEGCSDRQIAERLTITEGTAGAHVSHILARLGFHTRSEIAAWLVRNQLRHRT